MHTMKEWKSNEEFMKHLILAQTQSTFPCRIFVVLTLWVNIENETRSDIGFSTLHKVDAVLVLNVETTSKQRYTTLIQ